MSNAKLIKMALAYVGKSEAWLAREIGTTPAAFNQRMKTDKFTADEMQTIATALGAEYKASIAFPDGRVI